MESGSRPNGSRSPLPRRSAAPLLRVSGSFAACRERSLCSKWQRRRVVADIAFPFVRLRQESRAEEYREKSVTLQIAFRCCEASHERPHAAVSPGTSLVWSESAQGRSERCQSAIRRSQSPYRRIQAHVNALKTKEMGNGTANTSRCRSPVAEPELAPIYLWMSLRYLMRCG
jgi:hypothetical protein